MKIYLMGESAFVEYGKAADEDHATMLCIGSKAEVDEADENKLIDMIHQAIVWSQYREIGDSKQKTIH